MRDKGEDNIKGAMALVLFFDSQRNLDPEPTSVPSFFLFSCCQIQMDEMFIR
jgi:hypothetical protein